MAISKSKLLIMNTFVDNPCARVSCISSVKIA